MKRLMVTGIMLIALMLFSGPTPAAEKNMWISAANAQLKARPSASSITIDRLAVGTEVIVLSVDREWYQVRTRSGREGWIYQQRISDVRPDTAAAVQKTDEGSGGTGGSASGRLGGLLGALPGSSISAGSADASRSIRGLSPEATEYADQTGTPQQFRVALDEVLELVVSEKEIEAFLKDGMIGKYAE